jgi:ribose transport system permease protein
VNATEPANQASTQGGLAARILHATGRLSNNAFLLLVLFALVALFTLLSPSGTFLSAGNIKNIGLDTAEILILATGETFILIAMGIDLSVGSVVVFSAVIAAEVLVNVSGTPSQVQNFEYPNLALGIALAVPAALCGGALWGFVNGFIIVKMKVPSFIVTLGTLGMALGFAQLITGGLNVKNVPPQVQENFGTGAFLGTIPWLLVVALAVVAVTGTVLSQTRFGLRTYAIGASEEGARRAGVNVDVHVISLYVLMGLLAGLVGILDVARFNTASIFAHSQDGLIAIAAVVIGGTSLFGGRGGVGGTFIGAFIPSVLRNGLILLGVQPFWQNIAIGVLLIGAVYTDQVRRRRVVEG